MSSSATIHICTAPSHRPANPISLVLALLYVRAYALKERLELDAHERSVTREEVRGFLLNAGVGLASISIALLA